MIQEDRQLLFVELSSRLPYRVKCLHPHGVGELDSIEVKDYGIHVIFKTPDDNYYLIEDCKPYLRPMSSMTEEEEKEYMNIDNRSYSCPMAYAHITASERIDWLNKNMFDYRGLIPMGLAIEASEGMYNLKK